MFVPNDTAGVGTWIIIMSFDVVFRQIKFSAEPGNELNERFVCSVGKFSCGIGVAALDGDRRIIALGRADCPCHFVKRHTLQDRTVYTNDKMGAGSRFVVFKIFPVLKRCGAGIGNVMNNDIFHAPKFISRTGVFMNAQIFFRDQFRHIGIADVVCRKFFRLSG